MMKLTGLFVMTVLFPLMSFAISHTTSLKAPTQVCESSDSKPDSELKTCAEAKAFNILNSECKMTNSENLLETEVKYETDCFPARGTSGSQCFSTAFATCRFKN